MKKGVLALKKSKMTKCTCITCTIFSGLVGLFFVIKSNLPLNGIINENQNIEILVVVAFDAEYILLQPKQAKRNKIFKCITSV